MHVSVRLSLALLLSAWSCALWAVQAPIVWTANHRPTPLAVEAVRLLGQAGDEGLNPADYDSALLTQRVEQAQANHNAMGIPAEEALNTALTQAMMSYLKDLHYGRVDPRKVYANFTLPPKSLDVEATLREAMATGDLQQAVRAASPVFPLYQALRPWLATYRGLVADPAWSGALPAPLGNKLEPGGRYPALPGLVARLVALGDLPRGFALSAGNPAGYQGAVVDGVKQFQKRHGLAPDGVIGKATLDQLNVKPAERVNQIALTMERLRWTPLLPDQRMLVVNLPEFELRGLEFSGQQVQIPRQMNVIVGKALNTQTPTFHEHMTAIEFSPYWNVPPSIARAETVPKLRRDPGYFDRQGFEIVTRSGQVVNRLDEQQLAAVQSGQARIRQRPGAQNALGDIKFIFPNNDNIYMHHTPSVGLFKRDRRDFSHGCIRVESPVALAEFVLKDEPEWTQEKIRDAMENGTSKTIRIRRPLMVVIAYATALVKQRGGTIYFYADIYGHDRQLQAALQKHSMAIRERYRNETNLQNLVKVD